MSLVECPCCNGERVLRVYDQSKPDAPPVEYDCTHCAGKGAIKGETDD